jgi:NADPH:quinone reductase-like Zn-dependent oxidoreductase
MKAYELQHTFGIDSLTLVDRPEPRPSHGQVLLQMRAFSLNYRDLLMIKGLYNPKLQLPFVPFSDGVGRVAAVGEAATLPCAAVTAWHALVSEGRLQAGDVVLTQGTGGVSLFALQFARLSGARVIATSSSDEKLTRALQLGASDGINYKTTPEWDKRVRQLTGDVGVDHVVEVGGAGTLGRSLKAVRTGGKISLIGVLSGGGEVNPMPILMKNVRVQGIYVGSRAMFEAMNRAIVFHKLRPVVDRVVPFAEAPQALRYMESAAHFGKICIRV